MLKLREKNIVSKTRILIFNLKLLAFMDIDSAIDFYDTIKTTFYEEQFSEFSITMKPHGSIQTKI
jgi:hypothetical protein